MTGKISLLSEKYLFLIFFIIFPVKSFSNYNDVHSFHFFCRVDTVNNLKNKCISISDDIISRNFGDINILSIQIKDMCNYKTASPIFIDSNSDNQTDILNYNLDCSINEPLRFFEVFPDSTETKGINVKTDAQCKTVLSFTELIPAKNLIRNDKPFSWSDSIAASILKTYPDVNQLEIYSPGQWTYTNGFFINALWELYLKTNNIQYKNYVQQWADNFVNDSGVISADKYNYQKFELDDILPGRSLIYLYHNTGDIKYKKAADQLMEQLKIQPVTSDGGYWHKKVYMHQMWLDGIYMADIFLSQFGHDFGINEYVDNAVKQCLLIYSHTYDKNTGLLYHGWDESKSNVWADSVKGTSPEFWGRSIGWYIMAIVDILDYIPESHPDRDSMIKMLESLSTSLLKYQDPNGLWYQIIDKGDRSDNWYETSCTAMIAYAYAKGSKNGYLKPEFMVKAKEAFNGLKENYLFFDHQGKIYLDGTVRVGTLNTQYSDGSYEYYISVDRRLNDFKGIAALLYLTLQLED